MSACLVENTTDVAPGVPYLVSGSSSGPLPALPGPGQRVEVWKRRTDVDPRTHERSGVAAELEVLSIVRDDAGRLSVRKRVSALHFGVGRQGNAWSRWSATSFESVRPLASGQWTSRVMDRRNGHRCWATQTIFDGNVPRPHASIALDGPTWDLWTVAVALFGTPASESAVYPLKDYYMGLSRPDVDPDDPTCAPNYAISPWASAPLRRAFVGVQSANDLTRSLFGNGSYRRDLVKEVAQADMWSIGMAWQMRGLVPVDWIVSMLAGLRERRDVRQTVAPDIRRHLRNLDTTTLRRLTRDWTLCDSQSRQMLAHLSRWPSAPVHRVRSWTELHDAVARYTATVGPSGKPRAMRKTTLPEQAVALRGVTAGGRRVQITGHESDLLAWGSSMCHCIGTYGDVMVSGRSWFGAVCGTDGVMVANFEIRLVVGEGRSSRPVLNQLLGRHNRRLDDDERYDVESYLREHDVEVGRYWGS